MPARARELLKRLIAGAYSLTARTLYEPVVVRTALRLLGGNLHARVGEQGRRASEVAKDGPILDMPVGTGYFTVAVASRHPGLVIGADLAAGMLREAARAARCSRTLNLALVRADAHHLPFRAGAFEAVLCTNGLQVIPGLAPSLAELSRVLAPEGALFVSVVTLPLGGLLPAAIGARLPAVLRSRRDLGRALARAGFETAAQERSRVAVLIEARKAGPARWRAGAPSPGN